MEAQVKTRTLVLWRFFGLFILGLALMLVGAFIHPENFYYPNGFGNWLVGFGFGIVFVLAILRAGE